MERMENDNMKAKYKKLIKEVEHHTGFSVNDTESIKDDESARIVIQNHLSWFQNYCDESKLNSENAIVKYLGVG